MSQYLRNGKKFNFDETGGGSHPLVQKIFEYCDQSGWETLPAFLDCFDARYAPMYAATLARHGGVKRTENEVTVFLAALGAVFERDVRPDFHALNFPINDPLYQELVLQLPKGRG